MTAVAADFDDILIGRFLAVIAAVIVVSAGRADTRVMFALVVVFCHFHKSLPCFKFTVGIDSVRQFNYKQTADIKQ